MTMQKIILETKRLKLKYLSIEMANAIHLNSLDEDTRMYIPDEVFETEAIATEVIEHLSQFYADKNGPLVYAICLSDETVIGYVQAVPMRNAWELGYQIAKPYRNQGYAREAVQLFLPWILQELQLEQIEAVCLAENKASIHVLKACGFKYLGQFNERYQGQEAIVEKFVYTIHSQDEHA